MSSSIQFSTPADRLSPVNELTSSRSFEDLTQSKMVVSHAADSMQTHEEGSRTIFRSSFAPQSSPDETLQILDNYMTAASDEEALNQLHTLDRSTLSLLKSDIYIRGQLNPIAKGDAAAIFIEEHPRHDIVRAAVDHIMHRTIILARSNASTPTISSEVVEEPFAVEDASERLDQQEHQTIENTGFFSTICDSFCAWINDITNWIVKFCNGNEVEDDEIEVSLHDEVVILNDMVNDSEIEPELVQVTFGLLFNKFPEFKTSIHRLIVATAQDMGEDTSTDQNYADSYIARRPLGDYVKVAVRMYLEENQSSTPQLDEVIPA